MYNVSNHIPSCSPVVSDLLDRAVKFGGMDNPAFRHRINQLARRAMNSAGTKSGEAMRDSAAEAIIRGMLSPAAMFIAPKDMTDLFRLRNEYAAQGFLFAVCNGNPEYWSAVKASLVRSCTSLTLSGGHGAAYAFDAYHAALKPYFRTYQQRELTALLDAAETALALPGVQ